MIVTAAAGPCLGTTSNATIATCSHVIRTSYRHTRTPKKRSRHVIQKDPCLFLDRGSQSRSSYKNFQPFQYRTSVFTNVQHLLRSSTGSPQDLVKKGPVQDLVEGALGGIHHLTLGPLQDLTLGPTKDHAKALRPLATCHPGISARSHLGISARPWSRSRGSPCIPNL